MFNIKDDHVFYKNPTGVVQGAAGSGLYYAAYQNDIGEVLTVPFLLYVDDLAIYIAGQDLDVMMKCIVQQASLVQKWYDDNNLIINYDKTKYQIFTKSRDPVPSKYHTLPITLANGQVIEQVQTFKYLGGTLDSSLSFRDHLDTVSRKVSNRLGFLYGVKRHLTDKVMAIMISCHIHSLMDYCLEIWAIQSDAQLDSIQRKVNFFSSQFYVSFIC